MSTLPLTSTPTRQGKSWNANEDKIIQYMFRGGATNEMIAEVPGRSTASIQKRASELGCGRRGKAQIVKVPDESLKSENESLKAENSRITGLLRELGQVFEGAANHIKEHLNK